MPSKRRILVAFGTAFCALVTASGALAASAPESNLLRAVNAVRAAHGLQALSVDPALTSAARRHSTAMLRAGYFAHGNFRGRMLAFHVQSPFLGENLAWGTGAYAYAAMVISEWLQSPEHRANLLRPSFARIGIGAAQGTFLGNAGSTVLTADFAGR